LLIRIEAEINNSGTDYDYLQIMFEAKNNVIIKLAMLENILKQ
jgi:hypothetical protein